MRGIILGKEGTFLFSHFNAIMAGRFLHYAPGSASLLQALQSKTGKNERSNIIFPFSTRSGKNQRKLMMGL